MLKEIKLVLDLDNVQDGKIYRDIKSYAKKHGIEDESVALKSLIMYLHFLAADMNALAGKIKELT